ncbi:MAG: ATP synthase F1 subunit delta [Bacteroidota bacterium]
MNSPAIHNYAKALVELMKERGLLDLTRETAETLSDYFKDQELMLLMGHPKIPPEAKKALLQQIAPPEMPQEFLNFLNLIVDRGRSQLLVKIMEAVVQLAIVEQGYEKVTLVSSQPLTEQEQESLRNKLEALWQVKIYPEYRVNPNLLGGIIIQRGDKLYDGSLNGQLSKIKEMLMA